MKLKPTERSNFKCAKTYNKYGNIYIINMEISCVRLTVNEF